MSPSRVTIRVAHVNGGVAALDRERARSVQLQLQVLFTSKKSPVTLATLVSPINGSQKHHLVYFRELR